MMCANHEIVMQTPVRTTGVIVSGQGRGLARRASATTRKGALHV